MVKFCASCGTANTPDARFCAKCGASIAAKIVEPPLTAQATPARLVGPTAPLLAQDAVEPGPAFQEPQYAVVDEKPTRNWLVIGGAVGALLLIALLYFWLFVADDMRSSSGGSYGNGVDAAATIAPQQMFVMTEANIRDKPTTVDSTILGKMPRGSAVTGVLKLGEGGVSNWLELADGNGFIAAINLSEVEPPEITRPLNDKVWSADAAIDIWSQPDTSSSLIDRVSEGSKLTLAGLTANDFIEVKLGKGGIGYIADGAAVLGRLGGKSVAIGFNPQTCNFGGELGSEFAKIAAKLRAQWTELENREFVDEAAREKAYAASEGKSSFVKLQRSFEGLSVTGIAQHYESQSVYFADPPAKVIEVFRAKGFTIDREGNFPSTELYAGISATRGEGAAYGRSELGCGV